MLFQSVFGTRLSIAAEEKQSTARLECQKNGCPQDHLCRSVKSKDHVRGQVTQVIQGQTVQEVETVFQTPVPILGPVICEGCVIMIILPAYADNNSNQRANAMLTVTYDLRNRSDRQAKWGTPQQPIAHCAYRLRYLLEREALVFEGRDYSSDQFDHYMSEMVEGTAVGKDLLISCASNTTST